jgi:hypothetical protein
MAGPADSEGAAPAQDRSATGQTPEVVLTQEGVLTEEEVSVVAVVVLTQAVVAASVEGADLTGAAEAVVPAQAGALPEADLTNRPLTRGLKHRRGHSKRLRTWGALSVASCPFRLSQLPRGKGRFQVHADPMELTNPCRRSQARYPRRTVQTGERLQLPDLRSHFDRMSSAWFAMPSGFAAPLENTITPIPLARFISSADV